MNNNKQRLGHIVEKILRKQASKPDVFLTVSDRIATGRIMDVPAETVAAQEITWRKAFLEFDKTDVCLTTELHERWCNLFAFCDATKILSPAAFTIRTRQLLLLAAVSPSYSLPSPLHLLSWPYQYSHGRGQFSC